MNDELKHLIKSIENAKIIDLTTAHVKIQHEDESILHTTLSKAKSIPCVIESELYYEEDPETEDYVPYLMIVFDDSYYSNELKKLKDSPMNIKFYDAHGKETETMQINRDSTPTISKFINNNYEHQNKQMRDFITDAKKLIDYANNDEHDLLSEKIRSMTKLFQQAKEYYDYAFGILIAIGEENISEENINDLYKLRSQLQS